MIRLDEQYPALSGGVAERPRAQQDMGELLSGSNVWFDPSRGLTRRPAMRLVNRASSGSYSTTADAPHVWGGTTADAEAYTAGPGGSVRSTQELAYEYQGEAYSLFVLKEALGPQDAPVYGIRKSDGRRIVSPAPGTGVVAALANGANAAAVVGDLLVLAPRADERHESHPTYTVARPWAVQANQQNLAAWVRGGAFARPYKLTLVRGDSRMWVQYTTLSEAYPAKLDTSDIPTSDPEYSKKVNDRTNAYNAAATAWLASALADITPENIALRLAAAVTASGYLAPGATAVAVGSSVLVTDPSIEELFVEDGGDGSLIMAAGNTVPSAASVVAFHLPGKILKVLPGSEGGANSFYLKAVSKDQSTGAMTQVSWEECAGEELVPAAYFVFGAIGPATDPVTYPEGRLFLELSIAALNAAAGTAFPEQLTNISGDMTTNPPPAFYRKEISAMAAFQDRLVMVCAGGAVSTSQPGDYLNFFRTSMLTSLPRDPVGFTIIGGEGDTVRHAVKYDRNLLLVGEKQQYMIPGRNALVPGQAAASIFSAVPGMDTVEPVSVGGMVYFARFNGARTTVHAMTAGKVVEDPQVLDLTTQAPGAILEAPVKLLASATPEAVLLLTTDATKCYLVTPVRGREGLRGGALWPWELAVPYDVVDADASFDSVVALITGNGTPGAALGTPEQSSYARAVTLNGTVTLEAHASTLGPTAIRFDGGSNERARIADSASAALGSQDFVMEFFYRADSEISGSGLVGNNLYQQPGGLQIASEFNGTDATLGRISVSIGNVSTPNLRSANGRATAATRHFIQLRRVGNVWSLYVDGTLENTLTRAETLGDGFWLGSTSQVGSFGQHLTGYIEQFRVTRGADSATRLTTVPTAPWPTASADELTAKRWSVVAAYEHAGVLNFLWQARLMVATTISTTYHLASLDFAARTNVAGWWGSRLGTLPFTGYADLDTFAVVPSPWTGAYTALAALVPPTRYTDKGFSVPIPSTGLGAMRQAHPLTVTTYRCHYADTSYAQALVGSAIWWQQAAVNPGATPVADGGWAYRQDSGTPGTAPATTATADFLSAVPVGRLVHQAGVTLRSVDKHPFTISGVNWTGALHTRSDRG